MAAEEKLLSTEDLRHLQKCELLIANEIKRICEKNNIRFFMVGGTLLGAIRHNGFIPWDDDMDFGMERSEYERFCQVCKTDLNSKFKFQTWDDDPDYPFSFGKVRLKDTHVKELFTTGKSENDGVFVDVFPFDNVPDSSKERTKQKRNIFFMRRALWLKKGYGKNIKDQSMKQRIRYSVSALLCKIIPYEFLKKSYANTLTKYNDSSTECLFLDGPYSYKKNMIRQEWINDLDAYSFESDEFPSFRDSSRYLTHLYGDYMQLPPIDQRHSHDILKVDFGNY